MILVNSTSAFGARIAQQYNTPISCQNYCISVASCIAVDFSGQDNSCWFHTNLNDLSYISSFKQTYTNQYQLNRDCTSTITTGYHSCLLFILFIEHGMLLYARDCVHVVCVRKLQHSTATNRPSQSASLMLICHTRSHQHIHVYIDLNNPAVDLNEQMIVRLKQPILATTCCLSG